MAGEYEISRDELFHILQNARRRAALRYMLDHSDQDQFTMRDLAEEVGAWENDTTVQQLDNTQRQRAYIGLYQSHLPKLDEFNIIEYNQDRGLIEPTPLLDVFDPYVGDGLHDADDQLTVPASAGESEESGLKSAVTGLLSK